MGIVLPFYLLFAFVFLFQVDPHFRQFLPKLDWKNPLVQPEWNIISGLIVIGIQLLIGIFYWQQQQTRFIIQVRKYWGVLLLVLILTFFQPIIFSVQALYASAIVITPMACFISFAYSTPKRLMVPNLLFWTSVGIIVYNHWA
jgi:hypothetical protein